MDFFNNYLPGIIALCKKHKVKKLFAFGSVLTNRFNDKSDIDLVVDFENVPLEEYADNYFDLKDSLSSILTGQPKLFENFKKDILRQRAIERNVEIMGEAINRILKIDATFQLPNARAIVNTRNRVIHGYDSVTTEFLWSLIIKHIPALKEDIQSLLK